VIGILLLLLPLVGNLERLKTLMPERWTSRMETIQTYEEDGSAMGRIRAWHLAWRVAVDRPLTGGGFQTFRWQTYVAYAPDFLGGKIVDVHNSFFEVLAEHGFIALGLFLALLASALWSTRKIKKVVKEGKIDERFAAYADMVQVSLAAYAVGGMFLGRGYFDLMYHIVLIPVILKQIIRQQQVDAVERITVSHVPQPA